MPVGNEDVGDFLAVAVCRGVGGVAPGFDEGFDAGGVVGDFCVGSWCCDGERRFKVYHCFSSFVFLISPTFSYIGGEVSNDSDPPPTHPKKGEKWGHPTPRQ